MTRIFYIFLIVFFFLSFSAISQNRLQKSKKLEDLNAVINFANESTHGMLVVHRMLENYNQDINKYVDLESHKINFYTNKDLPKDIFDDPENWFYETSPYEWYDIIMHTHLPSDILKEVKTLKTYLQKINQLRFDLDGLIIDKDLTDTSALNKVYLKLEEGVTLYQDFLVHHQELLSLVMAEYQSILPTDSDIQFPGYYRAMTSLYNEAKKTLLSIRSKEDHLNITLLTDALNRYSAIDRSTLGSTRMTGRKMNRFDKNIRAQGNAFVQSTKKYIDSGQVPQEYEQYGKYYYYYNSEIINKFNRYGNGMVFDMNNVIRHLEIPALLFSELPHYFKVIYPKKLKTLASITSSGSSLSSGKSKIEMLPTKLENRKIEKVDHTIRADTTSFEVALYDHMIEDGDIISLNFNGEWIIKKMPLTTKKQYVTLPLNKEGKNYLILHAENVGRRPPNTMAMDYFYQGHKERIILKSDLNKSAMIEILYSPGKK